MEAISLPCDWQSLTTSDKVKRRPPCLCRAPLEALELAREIVEEGRVVAGALPGASHRAVVAGVIRRGPGPAGRRDLDLRLAGALDEQAIERRLLDAGADKGDAMVLHQHHRHRPE